MRYKNIHPCKKWYDCKRLLEGRQTKQHVCETPWNRVWLKRPLDSLKQPETPSESSAWLKKDGTWWRLLKGHLIDSLWDSLGKTACDPESGSDADEGLIVCAIAQICVWSEWTEWTEGSSVDGGLEEVQLGAAWGLMPLLLTYCRNWSGISARTSFARRAMLRMWLPLRSM